MDAFLTRLSYHATSFAIRSAFALSSKYVISHSCKLLTTIDHGPLRLELSRLQRRLARKIELVTPILETIELRFSRGDSTLEPVVRTARSLREDIESLEERLRAANLNEAQDQNGPRETQATATKRQIELHEIMGDMRELITCIDDAIPLINLWISAVGGIQAPTDSFSPIRLLQASMLLNVGDTQFILDPSQPMQIGPDFTLSMYMLFRGHASSDGDQEPYGVEEGQRKPMWQEVIHKARVRLLRISLDDETPLTNGVASVKLRSRYAYQLQIVEDLDDGRVHTWENVDQQPTAYDGLPLAGIRDVVPIHQIAKVFYADVGKILNINNDDGASSSPVLLLKRDTEARPAYELSSAPAPLDTSSQISGTETGTLGNSSESDGDGQDEINMQLQQELFAQDEPPEFQTIRAPVTKTHPDDEHHRIPHNLDPEWIALEVFENEDEESSESDSDSTSGEKDVSGLIDGSVISEQDCLPRHTTRSSIDLNLITQLNRMSISTSRPSSRDSPTLINNPNLPNTIARLNGNSITTGETADLSSTNLIERSPFGAIKTSLSLLEMLLRLTSLQEFEQTTHLAASDHVLKFYLDESSSNSGLSGREKWAASVEAERKVGFDPYGHH
ncbi:Ran-binding-domain-containing protein [Xylariaceae sp. FL1019]|nr:Ran-binding-domain-containing protein [Xylariaceae sp. FL1019]